MELLRDMAIGTAAGVAATGPMSLVMVGTHRSLPWHERQGLPPEHIVSNVLKHFGVHYHFTHRQRLLMTVIAHFSYGGGAGAVYAPIARQVRCPAIVSGTTYGLMVWAGSYLGILPSLNIYSTPAHDAPRRTAMMVIAHLVWGATLGLVVAAMQGRLRKRSGGSIKSIGHAMAGSKA